MEWQKGRNNVRKDYNPITKEYFKTQILSNKGYNFKALHFMVPQVKY
jgi:hypothetical protein